MQERLFKQHYAWLLQFGKEVRQLNQNVDDEIAKGGEISASTKARVEKLSKDMKESQVAPLITALASIDNKKQAP
jgi:hypothetical protein